MLALRATASLAVVLALLFGLVHLLRRSQRPSNATSKAVGLMTRGRLDLGARREIRLVEVEGRLLVVGITNERMELLTEMPAPNVVVSVDGVPDPARAAVRSPFAGVGGFLQKLTTSF